MTPGAEFHRHAVKLAANGYFPVPIGAGKKNPRLKGWESYVFCPQDAERYSREGCGLLTKATPAIDIDVRRKSLAEKLQALAEKMLGRAPVRIGLAPKCALLYRTSEPFKKMATHASFYKQASQTVSRRVSRWCESITFQIRRR